MNILKQYDVSKRNDELFAQAVFFFGIVFMFILSTVAIKAQNDDFLIDHLTYKETVHHINYYFSNYVDENIGEDNNLEEPYYDVGDDDDEDNEDNENNTPLLSIFEDGEVEEIDSVS